MTIRPATRRDDAALAALDRVTWSWQTSPAPPPPAGTPFFPGRADPADVLVAEDGEVVGFVPIGPSIPVPSNAHVMTVRGLAVHPARRGEGIGRRLVDAAVTEARRRGARRLTLRVLAPNAAARAVYAETGFVVEGVLRGEFHLDGRYVDDVRMARDLTCDDETQGVP